MDKDAIVIKYIFEAIILARKDKRVRKGTTRLNSVELLESIMVGFKMYKDATT